MLLCRTNLVLLFFKNSAECNNLFGDEKGSEDGGTASIVVDENTGFALVVNGHSLVHCLSPELENKCVAFM